MSISPRGLILYSENHPFYSFLAEHESLNQWADWDKRHDQDLQGKELKQKLIDYDISILSDQNCLEAFNVVNYRSVDSHFLKYINLVSNEKGVLWGHSVFSEVFREVMLKSIQNKDFKGSVIFLGGSPLALPVIDVLARFGFNDFVFLRLNPDEKNVKLFDKKHAGLLGVTVSQVNSAAFIQSQKEYSFCFIMEGEYPRQTLEDMSYFHFLSTNSLVFDLIGESNFLFKEVQALGVEVVTFDLIRQIWVKILEQKLRQIASKISK